MSTIRDLMPWNWSKKDVPVRRAERDPFYRLWGEMDRMFEDASRGLMSWRGEAGGLGAFQPSVDLKETDDAIEVTAELPGMSEEDLDLSLADNVLTLKGEKKEETVREKDGVHYTERSYGSFHRQIPLPAEVDPDAVEADVKNGVLHVKLPKSPEAKEQVKRIAVKTA